MTQLTFKYYKVYSLYGVRMFDYDKFQKNQSYIMIVDKLVKTDYGYDYLKTECVVIKCVSRSNGFVIFDVNGLLVKKKVKYDGISEFVSYMDGNNHIIVIARD